MADQPRKPYLDGGKSIGEMFRAHVRWLKKSNVKESQFEKPYQGEPYPKMHLNLPGPSWGAFPKLADAIVPGTGALSPLVKHTYLFPMPWCSLFIFNLSCKDVNEGSANIWFTPPSTEGSKYTWKFWSETKGVGVDTPYVLSGRMNEFADFNVTADIQDMDSPPEEAKICGAATFSGYASTELVTYGPPGFVVPVLGSPFDPPPGFTTASSYTSGQFDCGCMTVPVECATCVPDPAMAWDAVTSSDTIAQSVSVTVAVTGNNGPFTWSVSGTGFTLDFAETEGLTNTLNADASACGTATVTVTGCDGTTVVGAVQCTTGRWQDCTSSRIGGCVIGGGITQYASVDGELFQYTLLCAAGGPDGACPSTLGCPGYSTFSVNCSCVPNRICGYAVARWVC